MTALARQLAGAGTYGASSSPLRERDDMLVGGAGVMLLIMAFAVRRYRLPAWTRVSAGREGRLTRGPAFPDLAGRDWALAVASALVASAVAALDDPGDQARYREEWSGDLAEIAGTWSRLWWALGVRLTARSLRAAYRVPSAKTY